MKMQLVAAAGLVLAGGAAEAGGIDRSGQSILALFEKGRYVELTFGQVTPDFTGVDMLGNSTGQMTDPFTSYSLTYKQDLTDALSFAIILDKAWGADTEYGGSPATTLLGGTMAHADSRDATLLARYKFGRFSVHGGVRAQKASADITLSGLAYGPFSGYYVDLDTDVAYGYVVGAAYEIPDIALRVALTYNSSIEHDFKSTEVGGIYPTPLVDVTKVKTPQSVNLDVQTGIAEDTLLFGSVRWVKWSEFRVDPPYFSAPFPTGSGGGLVDLEDTITYTLGLGRKLNDTWAVSGILMYEPPVGDDLVSPLSPTNGKKGVTLAAVYTEGNMRVTTGVNYIWLGDAIAATIGTPRAKVENNSALGIGVKVGFTF